MANVVRLLPCHSEQKLPTVTLKIRGKTAPYVTSKIRKMIRQRDFLKAKANKTGFKYLRQTYQQMRNKVGCRLRKSKQEYFTKKIEDSRGDLKKHMENFKASNWQGEQCNSY